MSAEFEIVLHIASAITAAIVIAMIVIGIIRWKRKTHCSRFTINATVVTKRAKARRHHQKTDTGTQIVTDTFCYVTFKAGETNILELKVSVGEYMALNKGESGKLTFQGANFLGFEKTNGEIVSEASIQASNETSGEVEGDDKKLSRKRKQKVQAEGETTSEADSENKKRNRKHRQKVKATSEVNSDINSQTNSETEIEANSEADSEVKNEIESERDGDEYGRT